MNKAQPGRQALRWLIIVACSTLPSTSVLAQLADSFNPGVGSYATTLALQPDGKVLVGGSFTNLAGQARNRLGRLESDGSLDTRFNPSANGNVSAFAIQPDWKILVGGSFTSLGGQTRNRLGRLHPDGSLDLTFDPGANSSVKALAVQADGRILVGGSFTSLGGQTRNYLGRLNPDGSLDTLFNPGADGNVISLAVQPDGRIIVGGEFSALGSQRCRYLGRLNSDGSLDTTFKQSVDNVVYSLALQADGKIVVGGMFSYLGNELHSYLGRVNPDGSVDQTFNLRANSYICSLAVQADGAILVGGNFTTLGGKYVPNLGRLTAQGTVDTNFNAQASSLVYGLALQADGNILAAGVFSSLGGQSRKYLGRLLNTGTATDSLQFDGSSIDWQHAGSVPELWRTTFEASTNGVDWFSLGAGQRVTEGWRLDGLALPGNATLRARGYTAGGGYNASGWWVENSVGPAALSLQPVSQTNNAGTTATFIAVAAGTAPFTYQWLKDGAPLTDSTHVMGTQTPSLTLSNVLLANAGSYALHVSNLLGSATSQVATLTVRDPFLTSQPLSVTTNAGTTAVFTVNAGGSSALSYQWFKDGQPIDDVGNVSGAHTAGLTLSNVLHADAGCYSVVVTNLSGSVTSQPAALVVDEPFIVVPPTNQAVDVDQAVAFAVSVAGTAPISYQWFKDGSALAGATASRLAWTSPQATDAGTYWVVVSNAFGRLTSQPVGLTINLVRLDPLFTAPSSVSSVSALAVQADGRILAACSSTVSGGTTQDRIARFEADGSLDATFDVVLDRPAYALAVQPDGKILVGGEFSMLGGQPHAGLGRLNADGGVDTGFNPAANGCVSCLFVQPDGRIVVGGYVTALNGRSCSGLGRLNPDGTLDSTFAPELSSAFFMALAAQPDGKLIVGQFYSSPFSSYTKNWLQRLMPDGSLDTNFYAEADYYIHSLALQADGKVLVGGEFSEFAGQTRYRLARLNSDGSLDLSFKPNVFGSSVDLLTVQADGKILAGGAFSTIDGQTRNQLARLNPDGSLDLTFNPGAQGSPASLALQPDGRLLVGGFSVHLGGQASLPMGRLAALEPATQNLVLSGPTLQWLRGGTSPEVLHATVEASRDGITWTNLGAATRIPGGWQFSSSILQASVAVRARGFSAGASLKGSSWFVESTLRPRQILVTDGGMGFGLNPSAGFGFNLTAPPDHPVIIEGSTDLTHWTALTTNNVGSVPFRFEDPEAPHTSRRFYRARWEP